MHILDACTDKKLFAPFFKQRESWVAWFAFLAALFGLRMDAEMRAIFRECTGRNDRPAEQATEAWLIIGRRGGKSFVLALIAVFLACFRDYRPFLSPGERATIMVIAADRKQSRVIMRYAKGLLHAVAMLKKLIEAERAESIDLSNSVTIEVHVCSFRTVRGYTCAAVLCDEAAFWATSDDAAEPDVEVISALRPTMATLPNALLLVASSPYARRGALWEAFQKYFGQKGPILVWKAATRRMNPSVPQSFIDRETEKDPAHAAAEYGAEFRTDIERFVSREAVEATISHGIAERPYKPGTRYNAFADPSGGSSDSFTLAISHSEGLFGDKTGFLDVLRERRPPFSPEQVVGEFCALLKSYRIATVTGDRYAGAWVSEQFKKHGIEYLPSEDPKGAIYLNFLPLVNSGLVHLLDNHKLVNQLVGLERRTARGTGRDVIDHGPGGHDDLANAAAGALTTMRKDTYDSTMSWVRGPSTSRTGTRSAVDYIKRLAALRG